MTIWLSWPPNVFNNRSLTHLFSNSLTFRLLVFISSKASLMRLNIACGNHNNGLGTSKQLCIHVFPLRLSVTVCVVISK